MNNVIIFYPNLFNCYSKFSRKVRKIISNMDAVSLFYVEDPNDFVKKFKGDSSNVISVCESKDWRSMDITHAIVFDDGEDFERELNFIRSENIPLRFVKISITRVINIKIETDYQGLKSTPEYEYIGRNSYWGNPYSMYEDGDDREEVIRKFKYDFDYEKFPKKEKKEVYKLAGKRLGCFCKPLACHGDILADFLNSWDDGK